MKLPRPVEILSALAGIAACVVQWLEQASLGFPDGHRTEFARALYWPHLGLVAMGIVIALGMLWPGGRGRWFLWTILLVLIVADWLLLPLVGTAMGLDNGQGG